MRINSFLIHEPTTIDTNKTYPETYLRAWREPENRPVAKNASTYRIPFSSQRKQGHDPSEKDFREDASKVGDTCHDPRRFQ